MVMFLPKKVICCCKFMLDGTQKGNLTYHTLKRLISKVQKRTYSSLGLTAEKVSFVPNHKTVTDKEIQKLAEFIASSNKLLVVTGAGISTESGIPDYRSEGVGLYARSNSRPVQYQTFLQSAQARQRYWARNYVGWPRFSSFQPNETHKVFRDWEKAGFLSWLVTQNVDALHYKAGNQKVTELHGSSHRVICLGCDATWPRAKVQVMFKELNPDFHIDYSTQIAPDGDVMLAQEQVETFKVPPCPNCGGILKPDIVFFGDNVPSKVKEFVFRQVELCDRMLVAGSSLQVFSGYRIALKAHELKKPVAVVNIGMTRADHLADLKVEARCGQVLPQVSQLL